MGVICASGGQNRMHVRTRYARFRHIRGGAGDPVGPKMLHGNVESTGSLVGSRDREICSQLYCSVKVPPPHWNFCFGVSLWSTQDHSGAWPHLEMVFGRAAKSKVTFMRHTAEVLVECCNVPVLRKICQKWGVLE